MRIYSDDRPILLAMSREEALELILVLTASVMAKKPASATLPVIVGHDDPGVGATYSAGTLTVTVEAEET